MYEYQPGRSGKYPQEFLKNYQGYIHTDAYKGYEKVFGITRCFCWTHLRRYFVDALPKDINSSEMTLPAQAIEYINKLFDIETKLEVLSPEGRKEQRLIQEKPLLDAFGRGLNKLQLVYCPSQSQDRHLLMPLIKRKD